MPQISRQLIAEISTKPKELEYVKQYYHLSDEEGYNIGMIRGGMSSPAYLFVAQIQDYLGLDENATINAPGTLGNWTWRLKKGQLDSSLARKIARMTYTYGRSRSDWKAKK